MSELIEDLFQIHSAPGDRLVTVQGTIVRQRPRDGQVPPPQFSHLSAPRQALVRLCQSIDYGQITGLHVRGGEPVFDPQPVVLLDVKLDADAIGRQETDLQDFVLRDEVCRLLRRLDSIENGRLDRIEVRAGIPRRVLIEASLAEVPR